MPPPKSSIFLTFPKKVYLKNITSPKILIQKAAQTFSQGDCVLIHTKKPKFFWGTNIGGALRGKHVTKQNKWKFFGLKQGVMLQKYILRHFKSIPNECEYTDMRTPPVDLNTS